MKIMKRTSIGAIGATALLLAGAAQAALLDRDLDGDSVVDAYYDTDLDITWLRNASVNGTMNWGDAMTWVDAYSIGGHSDWRLPTSDTCGGSGCTGSEMGHLWHVELGNPPGGPMTNPGGFQNWSGWYYWSGTESAFDPPNWVWIFGSGNGYQREEVKWRTLSAMAVADGDIGMVPEPGSYALMLGGLAAIGAVARRSARRP